MKKRIVFLIAAVALTFVANAQFVVGLQGGYFNQNTTDGEYMLHLNDGRITTTVYTSGTSTILGGVQLGYQITPKIYAGVMGGYISYSSENNLLRDSILIPVDANSTYIGMWMGVDDHRFTFARTGWQVAPVVCYEFAKYGNMHFNVMLQGTVQKLGYTTSHEYFNKPFDGGELVDRDAVIDSISNFTWGVSLRPTLTYEFSKHLSAELSLDFLSIGYISDTRNIDGSATDEYIVHSIAYNYTTPPHKETTSTFYAGLNTLMGTLQWESPMLRLGFNYKF